VVFQAVSLKPLHRAGPGYPIISDNRFFLQIGYGVAKNWYSTVLLPIGQNSSGDTVASFIEAATLRANWLSVGTRRGRKQQHWQKHQQYGQKHFSVHTVSFLCLNTMQRYGTT
jgi:hypothetical protein